MSRDHDHQEGGACSCALQSTGVSQTMQELEFERGIWSAAMDGEGERVRRFLGNGVSPSAPDSAGYTPLHYASRSGHAHICRTLLSSGAAVNAQTPGGVAALHRAAYCGHVEVVELLLQYKADVAVTDSDGKTPLHKAAERGHHAVAKLLVVADPSVTAMRDHRGHLARDLVERWDTRWEGLLQ